MSSLWPNGITNILEFFHSTKFVNSQLLRHFPCRFTPKNFRSLNRGSGEQFTRCKVLFQTHGEVLGLAYVHFFRRCRKFINTLRYAVAERPDVFQASRYSAERQTRCL